MATAGPFIDTALRKLIDVSMRNRLLNANFGNRSTAVEIVDEQPVAIWQSLVGQKRKLQFRGVARQSTSSEVAAISEDDVVEDDEPGGEEISSEFKPHHTDNFLETRLDEELLFSKLRKLSDVARAAMEEQGVATLFVALGFLHFRELKAAEKMRRAPLLLVPSLLKRDGPDKWSVNASDDEPVINPALVEYLASQHGLKLPELPEEGFDPAQWFAAVQQLVSKKDSWKVTANCLVGNFSFQKFVMHQDLKKNAASIIKHPVVEQLALRSGPSEGTSSLPPGIRELVLDDGFRPEETFQVVDADSTQQRALAAALSGKNLVIQGPPGTGKSQTITNLISAMLAAGKTVLFVAEKQAALNVVSDRLKKAGLGEFCLELHSSKANKKALVQELKTAWDASVSSSGLEPEPSTALGVLRSRLSSYSRALHSPVPALGLTPFAAMGRLLKLEKAPDIRIHMSVAGVSRQSLEAARQALEDLSNRASGLGGPPGEHPWADFTLEHLALEHQDALFPALDELCAVLATILRELDEVQTRFGFEFASIADASRGLELAELLAQAPGVPTSVLETPNWEQLHGNAISAIERGRALVKAESAARALGVPLSSVKDLEESVHLILARGRSWLAWLSRAWWTARRRLKEALPPQAWAGALAAAHVVGSAIDALKTRSALEADTLAAQFFAGAWRGADSDWASLAQWPSWTAKFRDLSQRLSLSRSALQLASTARPDTSQLKDLARRCADAQRLWATIRQAGGWPESYCDGLTISAFAQRVARLRGGRDRWKEMTSFNAAVKAARATLAAPLVDVALQGKVEWTALTEAFERRFLRLWLEVVQANNPDLLRFNGQEHSERVHAFRQHDLKAIETNKLRVLARLRSRTQEALKSADDRKVLQDQVVRSRGHMPPRKLVLHAQRAIRAIKPCFLMSPMSVAQVLDIEHRFDVVVFDEASQLTCEDSLGAIARGSQLIVVGDPKQLPPTNFFAVQTGEVEAKVGEDGQLQFEDLESVLDLAQAAGFYGTQLRWHYRSRHESLIAYSNRNFYDSSLFTFPSVDRDVGLFGLSFHHVPTGQYLGKGINPAEADAVVAAVRAHARTSPERSLCVGTFSEAQQVQIQDRLETARRNDPHLDAFLALDKPEPFFVKNLESIQGDERDVVFLSVTYGPGADGRIRNNFGPLSGSTGWRRLNVLTTRARERMKVFSSMFADDISVRNDQKGAVLLRDFLRYAETGRLDASPQVLAAAQTESPFEQEVFTALSNRGLDLVPQVGVSGYRIDFGVVDPNSPGRFVCGIECDGATYHSAESARDRDRLREQVLRELGWELHRIWSTEWWQSREREIERILRLVEQSRATQEQRQRRAAGSNAVTEVVVQIKPAPTREVAEPRAAVTLRVPAFPQYIVTELPRQSGDLVNASPRALADLSLRVVQAEGPVHVDELQARLMAAFGHRRTGARIVAAMEDAFRVLASRPEVQRAQDWWQIAGKPVMPRNRRAAKTRPEEVASEEYVAAVIRALQENKRLNDEQLIGVIRDAFGFSNSTEPLRAAVQRAVRQLGSRIAHGSTGYELIQA